MTLDQWKLPGQISWNHLVAVRLRKYEEWKEKERDLEFKMTKRGRGLRILIPNLFPLFQVLQPPLPILPLYWGGGGHGYYNLAPWQPEDNQ